jgi:hypothetical protein
MRIIDLGTAGCSDTVGKVAFRLTKNITSPVKSKESDIQQMTDILQRAFPGKLNFTIKESARILNLSPEFLRRQYSTGELPVNRYGDRVMINIIQLSELLIKGVQHDPS